MTNAIQNPYSDQEKYKYNDLKKLCADRNLNASGTKEDLAARLLEADSKPPAPAQTGTGSAPEDSKTEGTEDGGDKPPVPVTGTTAPVKPPQSAEQLHRSAALKQKAFLDKQGKVNVFVPFEQGENPEQGKKIPMRVTINGHVTEVPRGVMVEVPLDIQKIIQERLESEGRASRDTGVNLASASADTKEALNA